MAEGASEGQTQMYWISPPGGALDAEDRAAWGNAEKVDWRNNRAWRLVSRDETIRLLGKYAVGDAQELERALHATMPGEIWIEPISGFQAFAALINLPEEVNS